MVDKKFSRSLEDYLETIYILKTNKGIIRVKDIAKTINVSMPSVTVAIKKLAAKNLVIYEKYSFINLTKKGKIIARNIYKKHKTLFNFFTKFLGVDKKTALKDACIMEHGLSKKTLIKLEKFIKKMKGGKK